MDWIGLSGGIASGKSTVAKMLREAGVDVIDADVLARDAVAVGSAGLDAIVAAFGDGVLREDGSLDRPALGQIVFHDADKRAQLNAIVHPTVAALAMEHAQRLEDAGKTRMVYEVPLLFENGLDQMMADTILVAVPVEIQRARLMERDGLSADDADARIAAQMSLEDKKARAGHVIDNAGSVEQTRAQLDAVWAAITGAPLPD